jgi:uncharacterized protein (TIGR00730 family)
MTDDPVNDELTICLYCASSEAVSDDLRDVAARAGSGIAARGWRLVYGGGGIGLMGEAARAAMSAGGKVVGIIPERLLTREAASSDITELHVVDTMRQRKHLMDSLADTFLVLPGGIGTLEEFMEIITLRQLGYHDRPVVLLDPDQFWAPLLQQFDRMMAHGLADAGIHRLFTAVRDVDEALETIAGTSRGSARADDPAEWDAALGP